MNSHTTSLPGKSPRIMHHFGVSFVSSPGCFSGGTNLYFFLPSLSLFSLTQLHLEASGLSLPKKANSSQQKIMTHSRTALEFQMTPNEQTEPALVESRISLVCYEISLLGVGDNMEIRVSCVARKAVSVLTLVIAVLPKFYEARLFNPRHSEFSQAHCQP